MNVLSKRVWSLNAPYGAPRFLMENSRCSLISQSCVALPCFLTSGGQTPTALSVGLNAPYGAPCFLTNLRDYNKGESDTS